MSEMNYKCAFQPQQGFTCEDIHTDLSNPTRNMGTYETLQHCHDICDALNDQVDECTQQFNTLCGEAKGHGYKACMTCVENNRRALFDPVSCTQGLYATMCALPQNNLLCGEKFDSFDCPASHPKMNPYRVFEWNGGPDTLTKQDFQQHCCTEELSPEQGPDYEHYNECINMLEANCDGARRASVGNCLVCAQQHGWQTLEDCPGKLLDKFCQKGNGELLCGRETRECPAGTLKSDLAYYHPSDNWEDRCCIRPSVRISNRDAVICDISATGGLIDGPLDCKEQDYTTQKPGDTNRCDEWYYWDNDAPPPEGSIHANGNWVGCQEETSHNPLKEHGGLWDDCKAGDSTQVNPCSVYKCPTIDKFNKLQNTNGTHYCKNLPTTHECVQCIEGQTQTLDAGGDQRFSYRDPDCSGVRQALCEMV